jgi:hypothetical protein
MAARKPAAPEPITKTFETFVRFVIALPPILAIRNTCPVL